MPNRIWWRSIIGLGSKSEQTDRQTGLFNLYRWHKETFGSLTFFNKKIKHKKDKTCVENGFQFRISSFFEDMLAKFATFGRFFDVFQQMVKNNLLL